MTVFVGVFRIKKGAYQFESDGLTDDPTAHDKHVHVIVLDSLMSRVMIVAETGTHTRNLVRCNGCPHTAAANENPAGGVPLANGQAYGLREIRVIYRFGAARAEIDHLMLQLRQKRFDALFKLKPCVVGSNCDLHTTKASTP